MEIKELLEMLNGSYKDQVRPLIEEGEYMLAYGEFNNLLILMGMHKDDLSTKVHMGMNYVATAKILGEKLKEEDKQGIESAMRMFEAYAAQTNLPLITKKNGT